MTETYLPEVDILSASPVPQPSVDEMSSDVVGTWKLVSVKREDLATGEKADYFGPNPQGYINYTADGRMMVVIVRSDRAKPAGANATADEAQALMQSVVSYAGTWDIQGDEITHNVEISWNEAWSGTAQRRQVKFVGNDRLLLDTAPSPDPVDGVLSVRSMVWDRVR